MIQLIFLTAIEGRLGDVAFESTPAPRRGFHRPLRLQRGGESCWDLGC